jgi:interleukin-1 receptor-associated kinase 1
VYSYDIPFGHISYKFKQFQAANLRARGTLGDLVDSRLRRYDLDQTSIVLKLAMKCTDQSPSLRPTVSQVVAVIEGGKTLEDISEEIVTNWRKK